MAKNIKKQDVLQGGLQGKQPASGSKLAELKSRLLFLLFALIIWRVGTFIPVPGIDSERLTQMFGQQDNNILRMFNMFSGGALERLSVFALNVMPYITASIIMQMAAAVNPTLKQVRKDGEAGRRTITKYTRYFTVGLALVQSFGMTIALQNQGLALAPGFRFVFTSVVTLTAGTMFLMWLGEQVTERGLGNGISMIILASIISGIPGALGSTVELTRTGDLSSGLALGLLLFILAITAFVVWMERAIRRITVNYANRQRGRKMYAGQSSHLPFKINMAGVIPPIFASSFILFPGTIASWLGSSEGFGWLQSLSVALSPGQPVYMLTYALLIFFFCFFYTAIVFNSHEVADNLKRSGAFIPGIRPGKQTGEFLDKVLTRLTFWGALYVSLVCLVPEFMIYKWALPFYFGGTSLLIIVVVVMDFVSQVQSHLMSQQYDSLLKKANLKNYGRAGQVRS